MKYLKRYNESTQNWGAMANELLHGYWSKVVEENDLDNIIEDVKEVTLPLSDMSSKTSFYKSIFFTVQKNQSGIRRKYTPETWSKKGYTQITTDGKRFYTVKGIPIINYDYEGFYSKFIEIRSSLSKAALQDLGWFEIDMSFDISGKTKKSIMNEYYDIKDNLISRGWWINSRGSKDEYVFDKDAFLSFDVIRPISLKIANEELPNLLSKTITVNKD